MKKLLIICMALALFIPLVSNAQTELWIDSLQVHMDSTSTKTIYQPFYSPRAGSNAKLDSSSFYGGKKLLGVFSGYNDGMLVIRIDSLTASMDTDSIEWKIQKLAHDGRTIGSTYYADVTNNILTTTQNSFDWVPGNRSGETSQRYWVDITGEMIDPHCVGLKHTIVMYSNGTSGQAKVTLFTYMVRSIR